MYDMKKIIRQSVRQKEEGQGLVEYALILFLVAVVVIAALIWLGPYIGNVFAGVNDTLTCPKGQIALRDASNKWECVVAQRPGMPK